MGYKTIDTGAATAEGTIRWMEKAGAAIGKLVGAEARVDITNQSVTLPASEIKELALSQRKILCITKYEATWLGSKAMIIVKGVYTVKFGYNLNKPPKVGLSPDSKAVSVELPAPEMLSLQTESQIVYHDQAGIMKSMSPKETEAAFTANREAAKQEALEMGMPSEAQARMRERIKDIFGGVASEVTVNEEPIRL